MDIFHCPNCSDYVEEDPWDDSTRQDWCPTCDTDLREYDWSIVKCGDCGRPVRWNKREGGWYCRNCDSYPDDVHFYAADED